LACHDNVQVRFEPFPGRCALTGKSTKTCGGRHVVPGITAVHKFLGKEWLNHSIYAYFQFSCADSSTIVAGHRHPDLPIAGDVLLRLK